MLVYPSKIVQCGCLQIKLIFIFIFKSSGDGVVMNSISSKNIGVTNKKNHRKLSWLTTRLTEFKIKITIMTIITKNVMIIIMIIIIIMTIKIRQ